MNAVRIFEALGLDRRRLAGGDRAVVSPIDGAVIADVAMDLPEALEAKLAGSVQAFMQWRSVPAPRRGELIRRFGMLLRQHKSTLGALITLEAGKITAEGEGEVQEMIDICDFAVGLSRQLYGRTIASERPEHTLRET